MRPAFDNPRQAAAFALLLLFLLAAPWLAGKNLLPPREQAYASAGWDWGAYPWIQKQIFEETNDIDIAFIGSSRMGFDIDTPYVQEKLDERLGRKTVVRSLCWLGAGFDTVYFVTKDLLEHRHVKTLVFYDEMVGLEANPEAPCWFRYGDDGGLLAGLPFQDRGIYYFAAVIGMPENLLELATPHRAENTNHPPPNHYETFFKAVNPELRLGSAAALHSFVDLDSDTPTNVSAYSPSGRAHPADVIVYDDATKSNFVFSTRSFPAFQLYFARQFGLLAQAHGTHLVLLHLPLYGDRTSPKLEESKFWPDFLKAPVSMIGIPADRLFAGFSEVETERLYCDTLHLDQSGQKYFTSLITPALLEAYEKPTNH